MKKGKAMADNPDPAETNSVAAPQPPVLEPGAPEEARQEDMLIEKLHACAFGHDPPQGRQPLFGK